MRKKVSWTGWRKQLKQYVTSGGGKVPAAVQGNGENVIKEETEVNDDMQHQVGDTGSTEPPSSSCEDGKSDESQREEKRQACIKPDAEELALSHLSPLTPPRPNSASAPQVSPPTPSRSNPGVPSALKKGAFRHVYRSGPVRKLSARTKTAANDAGARRPGAVRTTSGEQETIAATAIQAAFRGYRSRRNSSEDVWSEGVYLNKRLEKELGGQTQDSSTHMSQMDPHRDLSTTGADKNINGEWDTDTRSPADIEASEQYKQVAALKRERAREYALSLRRLKYGLEQKGASKAPPADCAMLDKPDYVMNWLERAQGARDNHVMKKVSDIGNLPSENLSLKARISKIQNGEKEKPKIGERTKPKNGEKEKPNSDQKAVSSAAAAESRTPRCRNGDASDGAFDTVEHLQDHSCPASVAFPTPNHGARRLSFTNGAAGHTGKGTGTLNERRKSVGSYAPALPPHVTDRRLSSPFAGMKAPFPSSTPKKLPFKV